MNDANMYNERHPIKEPDKTLRRNVSLIEGQFLNGRNEYKLIINEEIDNNSLGEN